MAGRKSDFTLTLSLIHICIKGFIFRTKTGEISVHAEEITLLSKSLQVLPEKFHGITDTDMRYRQKMCIRDRSGTV